MPRQLELELRTAGLTGVRPFRPQLLKWIGNKQRYAHEIVSYFPVDFSAYHEPFQGAGGVLGTLAPSEGLPPIVSFR